MLATTTEVWMRLLSMTVLLTSSTPHGCGQHAACSRPEEHLADKSMHGVLALNSNT
jgi:hypothetical protein